MLGLFDKAAFVQDLWRNFIPRAEIRFDLGKAYLDPLLLKDIGKAALRQTSLEWHLSALKPRTTAVTRARFLAFMAAAGGLAKT